ncbi:MAG TPA: tetratricopeptide repeat protein [Candidatus Binatia bacterium]|nr:tetratricopeptide repeat protein [Candidatus Binatia bacterium]
MASAPASLIAGSVALRWLVPLVVVLLSGLAFAPVLHNDFVNWDDRVNLLDNRFYRGLSAQHLQWMFTTFHNSLYRPLTWITLGADYLLWGMNPSGYHLSSLLLHCLAALLFYFLSIQLLSLAVPSLEQRDAALKVGAGFAALIFAVHPLRVEPIAWASGRENVVAGPFFILTVICYLHAIARARQPSAYWKWMVGAWLAYALSLLGKGAGVTLPFALLILDAYPLRRLSAGRALPVSALRLGLEKLPFFLLALVAGLLAVYGKQQSNLMYGLQDYGIVDRLVQTVYGLIFYLWKTLVPISLSNLYEIETLSLSDWRFVLSALLLGAISALLWVFRQRWPWGLAAWCYYCVILLPYVGVAQNGPQIAADRYTYLACLPWAVLAGAALLNGWQIWRRGQTKRPLLVGAHALAASIVVTLAFLSWRQSAVWRDSETLWRHALSINAKSYFAHHFLGTALLSKDRPAEALGHFQESLALNPNYASAQIGLANALAEQGEVENALAGYRRALALDGGSVEGHYGLARVLSRHGDTDGAIEHYRRALALAPNDPDAHNNLGLLLAARGEFGKAIEHFQAALGSDRTYARAHFNLGRVLARQGQLDGAIDHFRQALRLQPEVAEIHESLARVLSLKGKNAEATAHLEEAVRILKKQQAIASP